MTLPETVYRNKSLDFQIEIVSLPIFHPKSPIFPLVPDVLELISISVGKKG